MPSIKAAVLKNQQLQAAGIQASAPANSGFIQEPPAPPRSPVPLTGLPTRGTMPSNAILGTDFTNSTKMSGVPQRSPMFPAQPQQSTVKTVVQAVASAVSSAVSSLLIKVNNVIAPVQNLINFLPGTGMQITSDNSGNVIFTSTSSGDGLVHGDSVWATDSAWVGLRDDFVSGGQTFSSSSPIAGLQWQAYGTNPGTVSYGNGVPSHIGTLNWLNSGAAANNFGAITLSASSGANIGPDTTWALLENPGWKQEWIWKWGRIGTSGTAPNFNKKSFYAGLFFTTGADASARPPIFIGARYDTDVGTGDSFTLSAAANASAGTTAYTGTFTGGGSNAFVGGKFIVAGFTNAANNGTFTCTASSTTTLTLNNTGGVAESHAATASETLADTTIKLEAVFNNPTTARNNTPGTIFDTGLTPTEGQWYRLEILCTSVGVVLATIYTNGASYTTTFTVSQITITGGAGSSLTDRTGGMTGFNPSFSGKYQSFVFGEGSTVTVAGLSGGNSGGNGVWTTVSKGSSASELDILTGLSLSGSTTYTIVGYPKLAPYFAFGNDGEATPAADCLVELDFFAFVWNSGLSTSPLALSINNSRWDSGS